MPPSAHKFLDEFEEFAEYIEDQCQHELSLPSDTQHGPTISARLERVESHVSNMKAALLNASVTPKNALNASLNLSLGDSMLNASLLAQQDMAVNLRNSLSTGTSLFDENEICLDDLEDLLMQCLQHKTQGSGRNGVVKGHMRHFKNMLQHEGREITYDAALEVFRTNRGHRANMSNGADQSIMEAFTPIRTTRKKRMMRKKRSKQGDQDGRDNMNGTFDTTGVQDNDDSDTDNSLNDGYRLNISVGNMSFASEDEEYEKLPARHESHAEDDAIHAELDVSHDNNIRRPMRLEDLGLSKASLDVIKSAGEPASKWATSSSMRRADKPPFISSVSAFSPPMDARTSSGGTFGINQQRMYHTSDDNWYAYK